VDFDKWTVSLPKYGKFSFNRDRKFEGLVKQATVSRTTTGKYFISILVDTFKEKELLKPITENTTIGIDLGIKHKSFKYGYLAGIECDGAAYHSSVSARDNDIVRQNVLEGLGWNIYRIWSTNW
jgi:hypothetical protein